jgi:predicted Zn-dependent peptidase
MFVSAGVDRDDYPAVCAKINEQLASIRNRLHADELEWARGLLVKRLQALQDNRERLVRFCLQYSLVGAHPSRFKFEKSLETVTCEKVSDVARKVKLDTTFFLYENLAECPGLWPVGGDECGRCREGFRNRGGGATSREKSPGLWPGIVRFY